jgi:hypothetical protein
MYSVVSGNNRFRKKTVFVSLFEKPGFDNSTSAKISPKERHSRSEKMRNKKSDNFIITSKTRSFDKI